MGWTRLRGRTVTLRVAEEPDVAELARIRATPEVRARWRGGADLAAEVRESIAEGGLGYFAVELDGRVVGAIQWAAEEDPEYRHASIDVFLDPSVHGRGVGEDAVRTLATHLIDDEGFHRLVIDPAADNAAAIRCYTKVGFRPVGIMRQYERDENGWHDGLLMDLLAAELSWLARATHRLRWARDPGPPQPLSPATRRWPESRRRRAGGRPPAG